MTSAPSDRGADGYRRAPGRGPMMRSDIVEVYVFRICGDACDTIANHNEAEFLQLRRATPPRIGEWHPLIGHIEADETATRAAMRELMEEVGMPAGSADCLGFWALEQVHPYFVPEIDSVVLSPRFAARARMEWSPTLNHEHDGHRWTCAARVREDFIWPGQKLACGEILEELVYSGPHAGDTFRIDRGVGN